MCQELVIQELSNSGDWTKAYFRNKLINLPMGKMEQNTSFQ